jgi:hypothetical protein
MADTNLFDFLALDERQLKEQSREVDLASCSA